MTAVEPTTPVHTPTTGSRSRRDVLCGLMVALVAPGALVACSGDDSPGDGGSTGGATTGGTSGGATGGESAGGSAQGIAALADVPDGGGLVVDNPGGGKVLLARSGDEVTGYNAACTHMGTIVAAPENGVATCPSHGSEFDAATGEVKRGPASRPLATVAVRVEGDRIVLA